jgi:glycosyltransferase involved in cell wall biosynthesis
MKRRILIAGGSGTHSGVPRYVELLTQALNKAELYHVSDINKGGYDFLRGSPGYHEIEGLASETFSILKLPRLFCMLTKRISEIRPQVVWANSSITVILLRTLQLIFGYRLIVTYHGVPYGPGRGLLRSICALIIDFLTSNIVRQKIIIISQKDFKLVKWSCLFSKRLILPNPVVFENNNIKSVHCVVPLYRVVMVTRDHYQKNLEYAAQIIGNSQNLELYIYGDVSEGRQQHLNKLAGGRIKYFGVVDNATQFLKLYDLLLITSRYEGFPFCALEALSVGLAIAMTDVGGFEEISRDNKFVTSLSGVPAHDNEEICNLISLYRADEEHISSIRALAEKYKFDCWRDNVIEIVKNS